MRKVTITATVKMVINIDEGTKVEDIMDTFYGCVDHSNATMEDCDVEDFNVDDSR
jgi:hypothetical protein